ncbi:MAG: HAD-IIIA family hydrolase [Bryobacteraceae bacterium]
MAPIVAIDELSAMIAVWRETGLSVGFTCGAFDLLHAGHADYLDRARSLCGRLIVAVNSDESVRSYKDASRPIIAEADRMRLVAALSSVDAVILMQDRRPARLIEVLKPDLYVKGGDYEAAGLRSAPLVESYGGRVAVIPIEVPLSSSAIVRRIEENAIHAAPEQVAPRGRPRIVFLDRDGTILESVDFLKNFEQVKLTPGASENLRRLQDAGFLLVVVTNQQGIGLGYFDYRDFVAVNSAMFRQLASHGARISRIYYCPHSFADDCDCRKPGTRLIERALAYFGANAADCFLIGDSSEDIAAAERAGCTGIRLESGKSMQAAVDFILETAVAKQ